MNMSMTNCMRCGSANVTGAAFCGGCGAPRQAASVPASTNDRATLALILAIAGLVIYLPAFVGAYIAWDEMKAIREGRSQGKAGKAQMAFWLNLVIIIIPVVVLIFAVVVFMGLMMI